MIRLFALSQFVIIILICSIPVAIEYQPQSVIIPSHFVINFSYLFSCYEVHFYDFDLRRDKKLIFKCRLVCIFITVFIVGPYTKIIVFALFAFKFLHALKS